VWWSGSELLVAAVVGVSVTKVFVVLVVFVVVVAELVAAFKLGGVPPIVIARVCILVSIGLCMMGVINRFVRRNNNIYNRYHSMDPFNPVHFLPNKPTKKRI
jgi:hypothetical protein